MDHARTRYLDAKRTVDERGFDRRVRERLLDELPPSPSVVEFGAGVGVTVPRLLEWEITAGSYRGIERDGDLVTYARSSRADAIESSGYAVERSDRGFTAATADSAQTLDVAFEQGDALSVDAAEADLVIAQAFADLVPLDDLVAALERTTRPGGFAYLPITFDGQTLFQPDHPADEAVERAYHAAIDAEDGRDVRAGRHLLDRLRAADGRLVAAGPSDWIVRPRDGAYPADEAHFLSCILDFVADALAGSAVEGADDWLATRREQLAAGELTYVAHQYDLLYETP